VVPLEPFELLDYHRAGRERLRVGIWESARQEDFGKTPIRSRRFAGIGGGDLDKAVDHFSGALDALNWHATAMSIAEQEAAGFGKQHRIGRLGHPHTHQRENGDRDGES
jgi:hypothetical protein